MKEELKKLPYVPTSLADLRKEVQALWDKVEPEQFRPYTERLVCKIKDIIEVKGMATIH